MPATIKALGIKGMNNLPQTPGKLLDDNRFITPRIVLNADALDGGVVRKRKGFARLAYLANCHSLWAGSVMLCVADRYPATLCRVEGSQATPICEVPGPWAKLNYAEIDNLVYIGSHFWKGVYDLNKDAVRPWGLPLPPMPEISLVPEGDLPPGTYSLCYTTFEGNRLGGSGSLARVAWEAGTMGIELKNLPDNALCWITHANGGDLFLAQVSGNRITGPPTIKKLSTLGVCPPPGMVHFIHAFGRIWGACGKKVYYSDPFQYEWFRASNFLPFLEEIVMVAAVTDGLFVNSSKSTWFMEGTEPAKMRLRRVGDGAVPGTLTLAQVEGGGYEISRKLSQMPSPVWMGHNGFVVGTNNGHLVRLSESRVKLLPREKGAATAWVREGIPQIIVSLSGAPAIAESDQEMGEIRRNSGRLFKS